MKVKVERDKKGFSLIELLATLLIISVVLGIAGYTVVNIINNSEDKGNKLALSSVEKAGSLYVQEYSDEVNWDLDTAKVSDLSNQVTSFSCVSVKELVNKGYLKQEELTEEVLNKYVMVGRAINGSIIQENLDDSDVCSTLQGATNRVSVPTAEELCIERTYNGKEQDVVKTLEYTTVDGKAYQDAGDYQINFKLNEGFLWKDGTNEDKKIVCSIKKAVPVFNFVGSNGEDGTVLGTKDVEVTSSVAGVLSVRSSNTNYVTASITDPAIAAEETGTITIQTLATKKNSFIYVTLSPTDQKNYVSATITYRIGEIVVTKVDKPTASSACKSDLVYNKGSQTLTNAISRTQSKAYFYVDNTGINAGK